MTIFDDTRADWRAAAPLRTKVHVAPARRTRTRWHWNGPRVGIRPSDPHTRCLDTVRSYQSYHQGKGWRDIGYNGLICNAHGRAIEGTGADFIGAHSAGNNTTDYGIQIMMGEGERISDLAKTRAVKLHADLEARSRRTLTRTWHSADGSGTQCPGDQIREWVRAGMPLTTPPKETPVTTPTTLTDRLTRGSTGAQVTLLQRMLNALRGAGLDTDGRFGPATETAVIAAHKAWGIGAPHDVVGPGFRARINADWAKHNAKPAPAPTPPTNPYAGLSDRALLERIAAKIGAQP